MTPDGRHAVFSSTKTDVVSGDTNNKEDVFVRDTTNDTTTRVSVASDGTQANGISDGPVITNNGRYVLFYSEANNLATITGLPAGSSYMNGVYLRDTKNNTTELITAGYYGYHDNSRISIAALPDAISEDGRFVYYQEQDNNQTPSYNQIYVKDRLLNTTSLVSQADDGTEGDQNSDSASASCDGRFVAYRSDTDNLASGNTNGNEDIFLTDTMGTHKTTDITSGANGNSLFPVMSCDGNFVLFQSEASNLVAGDTDGKTDVFRYDIAQGITTPISVDNTGALVGIGTYTGRAVMSADGRFVGFTADLGSYGYYEAFLRDTWSNTTKLVSMNSSSQAANVGSGFVAVTSGNRVIYQSQADNLGVSNSNHDNYFYQITDY